MIHHGIKYRSPGPTGEVKKKRVFGGISFGLNEVVKDLHCFIFSNSDVSFNKTRLIYELSEAEKTMKTKTYPVSRLKGRSPSKPGSLLMIELEFDARMKGAKIIKSEIRMCLDFSITGVFV